MKLLSVIKKSIKEQIRSYWILILTVSMAPFFVMIYFMINESTQQSYDVLIVNRDTGTLLETGSINYGELLVEFLEMDKGDSLGIPVDLNLIANRKEGVKRLKNKQADALIIIPGEFTKAVHSMKESHQDLKAEIEFVGDLSNYDYMISAIWAGEIIDQSAFYFSGLERPFTIKETFLGVSGDIDEFDIYIPGILILSIIMLMFTASIALITEVENRTIIRLKLSNIGTFRLLGGISIVQVVVGIISLFITLLAATWLGFEYSGSIIILLFIAVLTCLSIISFSLIIAGLTKTVNEILVVGNFPLFLFMFFSGAAFPMSGKEIFSIAGYSISLQGLMSPAHAISALRKTLLLDKGIGEIIPEILALISLTVLYFLIGAWIFRRRHMKVN